MNIALWALQIVLAAVFLGAGLMKSTQPLVRLESKVGAWVHDVPLPLIRVTGVAEVLGAAGLILPRALHIVPGLAGFAALGLAITMVGAVVVHARRGEYNEAGINAALLVLCVVVAAGRL